MNWIEIHMYMWIHTYCRNPYTVKSVKKIVSLDHQPPTPLYKTISHILKKWPVFYPLLAPYFEPFPYFNIKSFTFIIQKPTTDTNSTWLTRDTNASYASLFHGGFWLLTENLRNIFNLRNLRYYVELVVCSHLARLWLTAQTALGSTEDHSQLTVIIIIISIIIITTQTAPLRTTVNWLTELLYSHLSSSTQSHDWLIPL